MRKVVWQLLAEDTALASFVPSNRVYQRSAVPDSPEPPFIVLVMSGTLSLGTGTIPTLDTYVHDYRGDYLRIDQILKEIRRVLESVAHAEWEGEHLVVADWQSDSEDLFDPATDTNTKFSSYRILGRSA